MPARIKKGDEVVVISGEHIGSRGKVLQVLPKTDRVLVEGINLRKRHQKKTQDQEAAIVERESPVHISNVMATSRYDARREKKATPSGD